MGKENRVLVAVIYGSVTRRKEVRDIDIVVYVKPSMSLRDFLKIEAELEREIGIPVDLVLIDCAPPKLVYKALTRGVRVVSRSSILYNMLVVQALAQIQDIQIKLGTIKLVSSPL